MTGSVPDLSILSSLIRLRLEKNDFKESISTESLPTNLEQLGVDFSDITDTMNNTLCSGKLDVTVDCYTNKYKCSCCNDRF